MNKSKTAKLTVITIVLAFSSYLLHSLLNPSPIDFNYLVFGCGIYDADGKIIEQKYAAEICDYSTNGQLFVGSSQKIKDDRENDLFTSDTVSHHDHKFSSDEKSVIQIEADTANFKGVLTKMDCAVRRKLSGEIEAKWCLSEQLNVLNDHLRFIRPWSIIGFTDDQMKRLKAKYEISHANSLYEIFENDLQDRDVALRPVNYIFNLHGAINAIVFLNHEMNSVLKFISKDQISIPADVTSDFLTHRPNQSGVIPQTISTHDDQIAKDGMILSYGTISRSPGQNFVANSLTLKPQLCPIDNQKMSLNRRENLIKRRTVVFKWNPLSPFDRVQVIWVSAWRSKDVPFRGWVSELQNGNYLISEFDGEKPNVFVVGQDQNVVWRFNIPKSAPKIAVRAKPLYRTEYLKKKGLL